MKRLVTIIGFLFAYSCFAQTDSLVINVRGVDIVLIKVEGGTYKRGCDPENKQHDSCCFKPNYGEQIVTLNTFYLAKFEVTQKLYQQIVRKNPSWFKNNTTIDSGLMRPVEMVNWYDAKTFIDSLNKLTGKHFRFPTEAEWEFAARGGNNNHPYLYAGSNDINAVTWFSHKNPKILNHTYSCTMRVGQKAANSLGLYDMTGNVAEWCNDWYSNVYYQSQKNIKNPCGPETGEKKVVRGGNFGNDYMPSLDVRYRKGLEPNSRMCYIGFRLAMDAE